MTTDRRRTWTLIWIALCVATVLQVIGLTLHLIGALS